jgi:hypothetical protein
MRQNNGDNRAIGARARAIYNHEGSAFPALSRRAAQRVAAGYESSCCADAGFRFDLDSGRVTLAV